MALVRLQVHYQMIENTMLALVTLWNIDISSFL